MNHYEFDQAWYFSAPDLAWDATLKITKVQLELLSDPDQEQCKQEKRTKINLSFLLLSKRSQVFTSAASCSLSANRKF